VGLLRLVLALSVLFTHVGSSFLGVRFFDGELAVDTFFMISGFYMALILSTRYRGETRAFYFNRFLRLFPSYWILLGITGLSWAVYWSATGRQPNTLYDWHHYPGGWTAWIAAFFANAFIVGTDALYFIRGGAYSYYLVIPPVWSVAVEISFYLFAPIIVRASFFAQITLFLAGLLLRESLWLTHGSNWSIWTYSFAPATVPFFMAGILAYRVYERLPRDGPFAPRVRNIGIFSTLALALTICLQNQFDFLGAHRWPYYFAAFACMPFVFAATKSGRIDAFLGQWSYLIYLAHWQVIKLYSHLEHRLTDSLRIYVILAITLALAALVRICDIRIQQRFKRRV